jgi:alkylation response protein AidB-like acyl-CoA dehydrogenase
MIGGGADKRASFVRALLEGRVDLHAIEPFPTLSEGRIQQVDELLAKLRVEDEERSGVEHLQSWGLLDRSDDWPTPLLSRVIRQMGATDASAALSAIVHLSLGVHLVRAFGSEAQIRELSMSRRALFSFALTEESPGSDVSRIQTYARKTENGFVLSGTKHWVTNALWATHFVVLARSSPPRATDKPRLTAFLVKAGRGVTVKRVESDVLEGSGVGRVTFDEVELSKDAVLGSEGKGFRLVMAGLSDARLHVGAAVLGACIRAFNDTVARVAGRRAFGRPVGNFPSVQFRIANMLSDIVAMESLVHAVAGLGEPGKSPDPVERGVVRLAVARGATRVLDAARELHGAAAYAGDLKAARHWADTRALTLLDGSDLALESYIVLEGTREIRQKMAQLSDPTDVLSRVDAVATHFVDRAKNQIRKVATQRIEGLGMDGLQQYAGRLGRQVEAIVRRHGVELVEQQHTQSRLASATTELATWSALASRVATEVQKSGEVGSRRMIESATVWVNAAKKRIDLDLSALDDNDDAMRDQIAARAYVDLNYPFDVY